jgi:hypothetical protein
MTPSRRALSTPTGSVLLWLTGAFSVAILQGLALGFSAHAGGVLVDSLACVYVVVVPWLAVSCVTSESQLLRAERWLLAAALIQGVAGVLNVILGLGDQLTTNTILSDVNAGPLLVMLVGVIDAALILVQRRPDPLAAAVLPFCIAGLLLSDRRSFALAGVVVVAVVAIFTLSHNRSRLLVIVSLALTCVIAYIALKGLPTIVDTGRQGSYNTLHTPLGDLYRTLERRNVLTDLERQPLSGLGFGVGWTQIYPLPGYFAGNLQYTHVGYLWFWLKTGLLGAIVYPLFVCFGLTCAVGAYRRADQTLRPLLLALVGGLGTDLIIEFTASFAGSDPQYTYLVAVCVGFSVAARLATARNTNNFTELLRPNRTSTVAARDGRD